MSQTLFLTPTLNHLYSELLTDCSKVFNPYDRRWEPQTVRGRLQVRQWGVNHVGRYPLRGMGQWWSL